MDKYCHGLLIKYLDIENGMKFSMKSRFTIVTKTMHNVEELFDLIKDIYISEDIRMSYL